MADTAGYYIEARELSKLMQQAISHGMSPQKILADLELPVDSLDKPAALLNFDDCLRILGAIHNYSQEETCMMSARPLRRGTTQVIFRILQRCQTVLEGLEVIAETYNIAHGGNYNQVHKRGRTVNYVVDDRDFHYCSEPCALSIECALLRIHCALSCLAGRPLTLLKTMTRREILPSHRHHLALFSGRVLTGQPYYELSYDAAEAELPLQDLGEIDLADNFYTHYLALLDDKNNATDFDTSSVVQRVMQAIMSVPMTSEGRAQELVAEQLHMSVATLRRRLTEQNTSFRHILDKVHGEQAVNYLQEHISPKDIAERLGYSDVRSFKRAFKRWYGLSPAAYITEQNIA